MFDYRKTFATLAVLLCFCPLMAQQVIVKAAIDSTAMLIGQQSQMHLEVSGPASICYTFPVFQGDTLVKGVEVLASGRLDTLEKIGDQIRIRANYLVTSFDSGLYYIPPLKIIAGLDTVESNYMALKIMTYAVDTTKVQIFDIKGVENPPFVLGDYALEMMAFLLLYILVLLTIWYVLKKKYGRKEENRVEVPLLPPHVVAIMELDRLKSERIWKSGKCKEFYTTLSDVLRRYIERRFQVNALEMTTDEILLMFRKDRDTQSVYQNLRQILQLADLVKFAKIQPLENENELSIVNSYFFVNQTKIEEVKPIEEQKESLDEEQKKGTNTNVQDSADVEEELIQNEMKKYQPK